MFYFRFFFVNAFVLLVFFLASVAVQLLYAVQQWTRLGSSDDIEEGSHEPVSSRESRHDDSVNINVGSLSRDHAR